MSFVRGDKRRKETHDPAVADIMALPFFSPNALLNELL